MKCRGCALAAFACLLVGVAPAPRAPDRSAPVLVRVADIPLPGPAVRFDYQSVDTAASRLYIAPMNAGELIVFNLATRKIEGTVEDLPRVTGVLAVRRSGRSTRRSRAGGVPATAGPSR